MPGWRLPALLAAVLGFSGVLMAALGAHSIEGLEQPANYRAWQAANLMHLVHAAVLLALGLHLKRSPSRALAIAAVLLFAGVLLFSGSIYLHQMSGIAWIAHLPPVGGLLLMGAWLGLIIGLVGS